MSAPGSLIFGAGQRCCASLSSSTTQASLRGPAGVSLASAWACRVCFPSPCYPKADVIAVVGVANSASDYGRRRCYAADDAYGCRADYNRAQSGAGRPWLRAKRSFERSSNPRRKHLFYAQSPTGTIWRATIGSNTLVFSTGANYSSGTSPMRFPADVAQLYAESISRAIATRKTHAFRAPAATWPPAGLRSISSLCIPSNARSRFWALGGICRGRHRAQARRGTAAPGPEDGGHWSGWQVASRMTFNNMLSVINGYAEIAMEGLDQHDPAPQRPGADT